MHEDHDTELHAPAPRFDSEEKAKEARDRWNRDNPGHFVFFVPPAPPEFTALANASDQEREKLEQLHSGEYREEEWDA